MHLALSLADLYKSGVFKWQGTTLSLHTHWQLPEFNNLTTLFREVIPNCHGILSTDSANLKSVEGFALKVARCARSLVYYDRPGDLILSAPRGPRVPYRSESHWQALASNPPALLWRDRPQCGAPLLVVPVETVGGGGHRAAALLSPRRAVGCFRALTGCPSAF